jgi:hypothetical protein
MAFRSHVTRPFDLSLRSNRLMFGLAGTAGAVALYLWMSGESFEVMLAPGHVLAGWALVRELDPDHQWPALTAGAMAGAWVLLGQPAVSVLAILGLLVAARLVVNTTGRRPLTSDLVGVALVAALISHTQGGWVAGSGLAVAIYIDDRVAESSNQKAVVSAAVAALGASVVATAARVFPSRVPDLEPLPVTVIGVVALALLIRQPPEPTSLVDSRIKTPIVLERLHSGRALVGILVFVASILVGPKVAGLAPVLAALILVLIASEVERFLSRR